jgi:hypothetical protein
MLGLRAYYRCMRGIYKCKMLILTLALILEILQFAPTDGMKGPERAISATDQDQTRGAHRHTLLLLCFLLSRRAVTVYHLYLLYIDVH